MRTARPMRARIVLAFTAALAASTVLGTPCAQAAVPRPASDRIVVANAQLAATLTKQLGSDTAGSYLDRSTNRLVVTVTTQAAAQKVRAGGAMARIVKHSGAVLQAATAELSRSATMAGTAWSVDPVTNQVLVTADSTVTGAELSRLKKTVAQLGDTARLQSRPGRLSTFIAGGDPIYTGGARCSLGFNVASADGTAYVLTAGHCTNIGTAWTGPGSRFLGNRAGSWFPGHDFGLIRYANGWDRPGGVNTYGGGVRDINSAADPVVGQVVQRSGSTTGVHGGTVTALNATVNYAQGTVTGMIQTTVCAETPLSV